MKITPVLFLFLIVLTNRVQAQPHFIDGEDPAPAGQQWTPIVELSDDFDGEKLDTTKWNPDPMAEGFGWRGRPPGLFRESSISVKDGMMNVTVGVLDEPQTINQQLFKYHGAIIRSVKTCKVGYYCECRMKANHTEMSSTFWLMTKQGTPKRLETDIQECVGVTSDLTDKWGRNWNRIFHSNAIIWRKGETPERIQIQRAVKPDTENWERFYVYGAWWKSPTELRFYLDGKYRYSLNPEVAWDTPAHYQMAIETYDWNPVPEDGGMVARGTLDERTTRYDWVRTWKLK